MICSHTILLLCFHCKLTGFICVKSFSCSFTPTDCLNMIHRRGKTELRHIAIYTFKLIRVDRIRFVPDAHTSICADRLVEFLPSLEMRIGWLTGELLQVCKRPPVLDQDGTVEVPEEFRVQEALFGICK